MRIIAISLGGSIIHPEGGFNISYVKRFCEIIKRERGTKFAIAVGGGHAARTAINAVSGEIKNKLLLDEIGIAMTRTNATALKNVMLEQGMDVAPLVPATLDEFKALHARHRITVFGGFVEGVTTDADAMLGAEAAGAKTLINIGMTAYVYDRNPKERGAIALKRLSHDEMVRLAEKFDRREVKSDFVFDVVASLLAARSKVKVLFVGPDIKDFEAALRGRQHRGTTVE
ncbi:hypothetical protein M1329_01410 [Candidatus Marsarchaeota archaeon]|nr:hypothetical protein [Candidatus Marsarchaeota archaeon]MCL5099589.1 hypothetical protein [Candidatus Marsarchaeota archaeon]